ncbi:hypothetical protein NOS3756_27250 [Nostoc sp. NIES-3756]|uniref:hypothetical protein n=1 Tax=Nostoc sp. NIES-3756 TaxID=1751286 RepID=UPI000721070A|nr:hypothetical protein [Nostoc sp. NIES-3756]BAT53762.1 hypothetical protein NOS3756_27250 [Nostoc sp. NIES-3756]
MEIKTISCERVINLGNYESRRLHLGAELAPGEDVETAIVSLVELVERKAKERYDLMIESKELRQEVRQLQQELEQLKAEKNNLTGNQEPDPDNIPFDEGASSPKTSILEGF